MTFTTKTLRNALMAGAALGVVATGAPGIAEARVYALALASLSDILLDVDESDGTASINKFGSDFTFESQVTADMVQAPDSAATTLFSATSTDSFTSSSSGFSFSNAAACTSDCVDPAHLFFSPNGVANPGSNSFSQVGPGSETFVRADSLIFDTDINKDRANGTNAVPPNGGGDSQGVVESELEGDFKATANVVDLNQRWKFDPVTFSTSKDATVTMDIDLLVRSILDADELTPPARARGDFRLEVKFEGIGSSTGTNRTASFSVILDPPDEPANLTLSELDLVGNGTFSSGVSASLSGGSDTFGTAGALTITFDDLPTGDFQFKINVDQTVITQSIPEPATIALLGAGLLGMGVAASRRRRRQGAAA